jgi:hypothetical protein
LAGSEPELDSQSSPTSRSPGASLDPKCQLVEINNAIYNKHTPPNLLRRSGALNVP